MSVDRITPLIGNAGEDEIADVLALGKYNLHSQVTRVLHTLSRDRDTLRAEVQRLTEESLRSDAGRVEVPEFDANRLDIEGSWDSHDLRMFLAGAKAGHQALASRLSPSPQPATGATPPDVVIIRNGAYNTIWWTSNPNRPGCGETMDDLLRQYPHAIREDLWRHPPQPSADVVVVPRPLSEAPTDRPILAFWQSALGTISDVVHYFDEEGRFVCWCEMLEYDDNGGELDFVPRDAQWIELPDALRSSTNHDAQDAGEGR